VSATSTLRVRRAIDTDEYSELVGPALHRVRRQRGGLALLDDLWGSDRDEDVAEGLARDVSGGGVWLAWRGDELVALALVRERVLCALYVLGPHRRQGIATSLVRAMIDSPTGPRDGWALPGDRATKSLYESLGWKARLLTMRGE